MFLKLKAAGSIFLRTKGLFIPGCTIAIIALVSLLAGPISPYNPLTQEASLILAPPSPEHWLGTDSLGRDVLSRIIHGGGLTLMIGFVAASLSLVAGGVVGVLAGYVGRRTDYTVMRGVDAFLAFPAILLALSILAGIGPGLMNLSVAVSVVYFASFALMSRILTLREREMEYVTASIAGGATKTYTLVHHVLPNIIPGLLAHLSLVLPLAVLTEAALSFLGFSADPSAPSWGRMIQEGSRYLFAPHAVLAPMTALAILVLSLQVMARALQRTLDPTIVSARTRAHPMSTN